MTIKGPKPGTFILHNQQYAGAQDVDVNRLIDSIAESVLDYMNSQAGMPVEAFRDEYQVGGGLFGKPKIGPAIVFRSKQHSEYAPIFAALTTTGSILEVLVAQKEATSKNYQKVQQGKLFSDKAAAQEEDTYYQFLSGAILAAVDFE